MNRNIDNLGRIVIPKEIRKSFGIKENDSLKIEVIENKIILHKENNDLQAKYNKALEVLCEYCIPCEIGDFADKNEDYCSKNCSTDERRIKQCWNRFIEQKLKGE